MADHLLIFDSAGLNDFIPRWEIIPHRTDQRGPFPEKRIGTKLEGVIVGGDQAYLAGALQQIVNAAAASRDMVLATSEVEWF